MTSILLMALAASVPARSLMATSAVNGGVEFVDITGRAGEGIAADGTAGRRDEMVPLEVLEDASEKGRRNGCSAGHALEKHHASLGLERR